VLLLRELCRDALERGLLVRRLGAWTWRGTPVLGARLQELLDARVGQLVGPEREAVALLALGEPLPRAVLVELTSSATVDDLVERGLVISADADGPPGDEPPGNEPPGDDEDETPQRPGRTRTCPTRDRSVIGPPTSRPAGCGWPTLLYAESLRSRLGPLETTDLYARLAGGLAATPPAAPTSGSASPSGR
jgi:hypothetical protein